MYRVMLVDDEPWILQGLASLITRLNPRLEICGMFEDPAQALQSVESLRPDALLTDIRMPDMNGLELIRALRERHTGMEVVVISAHRDFEVAKDAFELDVRQYLLKPFNKAEVAKVLDRIVQRLDESSQSLAAEQSALLRKAAVYPYCWVLIAPTGQRPLPAEGTLCTEYPAQGAHPVYLCATQQKDPARGSVSPGGESTIRADFADIDGMLREAAMSLDGGFRFSENTQVAGIQKYLYDLHSQKLDAKAIAAAFYLSPGYLSALFKKETGTTMVNFFHQVHMRRAALMLTSSSKQLSQLAEEVGYSDYNYFARMFKRLYGVSPEAARKSGLDASSLKQTDV